MAARKKKVKQRRRNNKRKRRKRGVENKGEDEKRELRRKTGGK